MKKVSFLVFCLFYFISFSQEIDLLKVLPDSLISNHHFARRVAIDGNTMVISSGGSKVLDIEKNNLVYVYERVGADQWRQTQILCHDDFSNYSFGHSLAISDGFIFIYYSGITNANRSVSRVGVYQKNDEGQWEMSQELSLKGRYIGSFGYCIRAENGQLVVSASAKDLNSKSNVKTKQADVFELVDGKWVWKNEILSDGLAEYNVLEPYVDVEGDKAFVKGYYSNPNDVPVWYSTITVKDEKGKLIAKKSSPCASKITKVYVFSLQNEKWVNTQILECWEKEGWGFGSTFSAYGDYLAVTAFRASIDERKNLAGAVYVFKKDSEGNYQPFQRILPNDTHIRQRFGSEVTMNDQYLIVGSKDDELNAKGRFKKDRAGACYVFQKDTNGMFVQTQKFVSDTRQKMGHFGRDVAISGNSLVIGSGDQSIEPKYRGDFHDEGAAFTAELIPIPKDEIEVLPIPDLFVPFDSTFNADLIEKDTDVTVFPNPSNGIFTLKRNVKQKSEVLIYSALGREIYRGDFNGVELSFTLDKWPSGLYYVQIRSSGSFQNIKVVLTD